MNINKQVVIDALLLSFSVSNCSMFWSVAHPVIVQKSWLFDVIGAYFIGALFTMCPYLFYIIAKDALVMELDRKHPGIGALILSSIFTLCILCINISLFYITFIRSKG